MNNKYIKACSFACSLLKVLVKASFWLKDKVCILLVSEIYVLVFCYNVANVENNMLLMLIIV